MNDDPTRKVAGTGSSVNDVNIAATIGLIIGAWIALAIIFGVIAGTFIDKMGK